MSALQGELQRLSGTNLAETGAANVWSATSGLDLVGAPNAKAGNTGSACRDLQGVCNQLAGSVGLAEVEALRRVVA